jgi:serine/threonine protein kinase
MARLSHPCVVQVHELAQQGPTWLMVMEYVDGIDLGQVIDALRARGQLMPIGDALHVVISVLRALDHAHTTLGDDGEPLGIVHRDISPGNVLCAYRTGEVKLTDFGVARARLQRHITDKGVRRGKIGYMAPEQYLGGTVDARADVFAIGRLLHQLLTGELIDQTAGTTPAGPGNGRRTTRPPLPESAGRWPAAKPIDPGMASIIRRATASDPEARWPTARAMLDALLPLRPEPMAEWDRFAALLEQTVPSAQRRLAGSVVNATGETRPGSSEPEEETVVVDLDSELCSSTLPRGLSRDVVRLPALVRPDVATVDIRAGHRPSIDADPTKPIRLKTPVRSPTAGG